jgi:hypothetical protein
MFPILAVMAAVLAQPAPLVAQNEAVGHHIMLSSGSASVAFDLADGASRLITVGNGQVSVDGQEVATYDAASDFGAAWLALIEGNAAAGTAEVLAELQAWAGSRSVPAAETLADVLGNLHAVPLADVGPAPQIVVAPRASGGEVAVSVDVNEINARVQEALAEARVALGEAGRITIPTAPDAPAAVPAAPVAAVHPSMLGSVGAGVASLGASLIAMMLMGFGFLIFAPNQFRAVGDTAWNSFGRSFLAGFFAQPLLVPVLGALIVALSLTIVGVLLVPLAILAFPLAIFLGVTGGYIAIARTVGEIYYRRKHDGVTPTQPWVEMKFMWYGLLAMLGIWIPAVLLGWIPVVGPVFTVLASVLTWVLATAGFGASIISRGGVRGTVIRRLDRTLSEGDYWSDTGAFRRSRSHAEYE